MERLKKIWLWISGGILAIFGLVLVFSRMFNQSKEKRRFKNDVKTLEKEFNVHQDAIDKIEKHKRVTKNEIEKTKSKIAETKSKVKDTKDAVDTLKDFKKKHKK